MINATDNSVTAATATTIPATQLLYLDNTYQFEGTGRLVHVGSDQKGTYIVFDQTIFYPQGGGQPADTGIIEFADTTKIGVTFTGFNPENSTVHHYVKEIPAEMVLQAGMPVKFYVNSPRRMESARAHTAGHLIGSIAEEVFKKYNIVAAKGYHFQDNPYVQFEGELPDDKMMKQPEIDAFVKTINEMLATCIREQRQVMTELANPEDLKFLKLPSDYKIPVGKPCRIAQIQGFAPVPCGGTHVKSLGEFASIVVKKISGRKGPKLSYNFVAAANKS